MIWGYAHVWPKTFLSLDEDPVFAKVKFIHRWGLTSVSVAIEDLMATETPLLNRILDYVAKNDLVINPVFHGDIFVAVDDRIEIAAEDSVARKRDKALEFLRREVSDLRANIVTTLAGPVHRFMASPSLTEQLDVMRARLSPFAEGLREFGIPLGVENHGDYYVEDVVALVKEMPNSGVFIDTGNTYLLGEQPLPAIRAGAPYAVGSHFKDQMVRPRTDARPIHFEVAPAVTGEGHVPLREAFEILKANAPNADRLSMEIELIPPANVDPVEAMRRSVAFIATLDQENIKRSTW